MPIKPINPVAHSAATREKAMLWLDKYRPQRFIDLLSDERTNREVLTWIKKWDRYVFPDKKPMTDIASPTGFNSRKGTTWKTGGSPHSKHGMGKQHGEDNEQPVDKRPFEKIILICGPPGAGKTTLANIIARHAGYNPIEINASDDRTAGVLKNKVRYRPRDAWLVICELIRRSPTDHQRYGDAVHLGQPQSELHRVR